MHRNLQLKVAGRWVSTVAPWGDLEWSTCTQGSDELSFNLLSDSQPFQGRQRVLLYDGPFPIWGGLLQQPGDTAGPFTASGWWREAYHYEAYNASGLPTRIPNVAVDQAISRGLPWTRVSGISASGVSTAPQGEVISVGELLDYWADQNNQWWTVSPTGEVFTYSTPTASEWHITPGSVRLVPADDDYVTRLGGLRKDGDRNTVPVPAVEDTTAAARWGPREETIDLTELGELSEAAAQQILQGKLNKGRARLGWGNPLVVSKWQLTTAGGVSAYMPMVQAGSRVTAHGLWDDTRELAGRTQKAFMLGRTVHAANDPDVIRLEPVGMAARDFLTVMKKARRKKKGRKR